MGDMNKAKGTLVKEDYEEFKNCNELDILYKMITILEDLEPRIIKSLQKNKAATKDVRKKMTDIKIMANIIRDLSITRIGGKGRKVPVLDQLINEDQKRIDKLIHVKNQKLKTLSNKKTNSDG